MKNVVTTDDENRLVLLVRAKQLEEQYNIHEANEQVLLSDVNKDAPSDLIESFLNVERVAKQNIEEEHTSIVTELDKISLESGPPAP